MTLRTVAMDSLTLDPRLQCRLNIPQEVIEDYAESIKDGAKMPALRVVEIDGTIYVVDGFARYNANLLLGKSKVQVDTCQGKWDDAVRLACGANVAHGLRRTTEDKRRSVELALKSFPTESVRKLSELCGVSHSFVQAFIAENPVEGREVKPKVQKPPKAKAASTKNTQVVADDQNTIENAKVPDVKSLGPCPVCKHDEWLLTDGGRKCDFCGQEYGCEAGIEPEELEDESADDAEAGTENSLVSLVGIASDNPESVGSGDWDGAEEETALLLADGDEIKKARAHLGRLIRSITTMGFRAEFDEDLRRINKRLGSIKEQAK